MWPRTTVVLLALSVSSTTISADREAGRDVFYSAGCIACHAIECNRDGPKLGGIIGRRAGSVPDYESYSEEMKGSGVIWSEESLDAYLANPATFIPGNGMATSAGSLEDEVQRRDLIAFLAEPDNTLDLCF